MYRLIAQGTTQGWTPDIHRQIARLYYDTGDYDSAAAHWQAVLLTTPDDLNTLRQLAETYLALQDWTPAADSLRALIALLPNEAWARYQLGMILAPRAPAEALLHLERLQESNAYGEVVTRLVIALRASMDEAARAMQVGIILVDYELWGQAEAAFQQAADLSYPNPEALAYSGLARGMQGKDGDAWMGEAIRLNPASPLVYYLYGVYLRGRGEYAASLDAFMLALSFDPTNPAYYAEVGNTYRKLGDLSNADRWLNQALAVSEYDPQFQNILRDFYDEEASALAAAGIDTAPSASANADAQADVGWTLYRVGSLEQATAAFASALEIEPQNPRVRFYQARIAIDTGNIALAKVLLEQVIDQGEDFAAEARQLLDAL
jgi:tetratricopeptide (TPR) repeat protein